MAIIVGISVLLVGAGSFATFIIVNGGDGSAEDTLREQVRAWWTGDADGLIETFGSGPFMDLGGCSSIPHDQMVANLRNAVAGRRAEFEAFDDYEDLVDFDAMNPVSATSISFVTKCGDTGITEDDVWVVAPNKAGSPFDGGFGGVYRNMGGKWVMIAGD